MTKIGDLINRVDKLDTTKKELDKKTYENYLSMNDDLKGLYDTILATGITPPRKK